MEEKGVDVALAACAFEWAVIESVDRIVIFSHDTDLSSIVEVIARTKGPQTVETIEDQTHYGREARRRLEEKAALSV